MSRRTPAVVGFTSLLAVVAVVVTVVTAGLDRPTPVDGPAWVLPVLALLVAAAELLVVRLRVGRDVDALNLVEAVLAPLLVAHGAVEVVLVVAAGQALAAVLRRNAPVKGAFNVAQWSLAAACGAAVVAVLPGRGTGAAALGSVLAALLVVEAVNVLAFRTVLSLATGTPWRLEADRLGVVGTQAAVNAATGVLFVLAVAASPVAVLVFAVPLALLHLAHRGQVVAQTERARVAGLHRAATALVGPLEPRAGVPEFLAEVARTFDARGAVLALDDDVHRHGPLDEAASRELATAAAVVREPRHVDDRGSGPLAAALRSAGCGECLVAPLLGTDGRLGTLLVLDRDGLEGDVEGAVAVAAAMAREASGTLAKGRLVQRVLDERRKLDTLVSTTSDGIAALAPDGTVVSWNAAMERITGLSAAQVLGVPGALEVLAAADLDGRPVDLARWPEADERTHVVVSTASGPRHLECSSARSGEGPGTVVVIARDVTPAQEVERLRAQFAQLVQAEAAQRVVVEHLQHAVMPPLVQLPGTEVGVRYVASEEESPTGGDLYDCLLLPDGDLHLAVVDVLGHGTHATRDALAVVHALRNLVLADVPLDDLVGRADALLGRSDPDLVATVVVARYTPSSGRVRLVSGGHPPALVVRSDGHVVELEPGGCALGWPAAGSGDTQEVVLEAGDALLLYTDGLVEADKDLDEGLRRLTASAGASAHLPAARLAEVLVDRALAGAARRDDTLALVLRRLPAAAVPAQERGATAVGR
jgi:PAS domain S-box-containing protein